jgi:hypothetical protein
MTSITIELPDDVASQARAAGLLGSQQVLAIFRESLRAAARSNLFALLDKAPAPADALPLDAQEQVVQEAKRAARKQGRSAA